MVVFGRRKVGIEVATVEEQCCFEFYCNSSSKYLWHLTHETAFNSSVISSCRPLNRNAVVLADGSSTGELSFKVFILGLRIYPRPVSLRDGHRHLTGSHSSCSHLITLTLAFSPISTLFIDLPLKAREKSIAIYFPSHIYPLQSLTISFSPWAANYRVTPMTSWAVICEAAGPHPLDLLSLSIWDS